MEPGGNSGIFAWSDAIPFGNRLPRVLEIKCSNWTGSSFGPRRKKPPPIAYVHGELFGAGGLKATPDNPVGSRSKSLENRCKGKGEWNVYDVVCVDGVVKLSVSRKIRKRHPRRAVQKRLPVSRVRRRRDSLSGLSRSWSSPPGITSPEQTAPLVK